MLEKSRNTIERYLRDKGFTSPDSRRTVASHVLLTAAAWCIGVLALPLTTWGVAFAFGSLLATINLWQIARFSQWSVTRQFTGRLAVLCFVAFLFRFAGTGIVLYFLLVQARMPIIPLVAGLSSLIIRLSVMYCCRAVDHSCKEA